MTAPDTNLEKQGRRHRPALLGIAAAIATIGIVVLFVAILADPPADAGGETGAPTAAE